MSEFLARFNTFGRKNANNRPEVQSGIFGHTSNGTSNENTRPSVCDGTCNCVACEKRIAAAAGLNGNGHPPTTTQQTAISDSAVEGGAGNKEIQNEPTKTLGPVEKNNDSRLSGFKERISNRVSQVGSALKRRTRASKSQSEDTMAQNDASCATPETISDPAPPSTAAQSVSEPERTRPNPGLPFPHLAPCDKEGNTTTAQSQPIIPPTISEVANGAHVYNGPWEHGRRVNGEWVPIGDVPVITGQAGVNEGNNPSSIQANQEEGMTNAPLRVIPWDVGNDPDHHLVRTRGEAALIHAGVRPVTNGNEVTNRNSRHLPTMVSIEVTTTHIENANEGH